MRVAILGYDAEGKASFDYFKARGDELTICDPDPNITLPSDVPSQLGENFYLANLDSFDLLVRSPSLHPSNIIAQNPNVASKITSGTNEFMRVCPSQNIIGVTGTKGKGTTSTLIAKILEADSKQVFLGGGVDAPMLPLLPNITRDSWVVLELSNFQLIDLQSSPHIAVCLMVAPEQLNWHKDMAEYVAAKSQLFAHQQAADIAIYFADNDTSKHIARNGQGQKVSYYSEPGAIERNGSISIDDHTVCETSELKLPGEHNWQNVCAALTAIWLGLNPTEEQLPGLVGAAHQVLTSFAGLEHRLEFVQEISGVQYYDDSSSTTPKTAITAIKAFRQPKIIILGGSSKNADYSALAEVVKNGNVRTSVVIGQTGPAIIEALSSVGYTNILLGGNTINEIVKSCHDAAQLGDVVLFSPACASFDMFENYKDRGNAFKSAVADLAPKPT